MPARARPARAPLRRDRPQLRRARRTGDPAGPCPAAAGRRARRPRRGAGAQRHGDLGGLPGGGAAGRRRRPGELPAGPRRGRLRALRLGRRRARGRHRAGRGRRQGAGAGGGGREHAGDRRRLRGGAGRGGRRAPRRRRRRGRAGLPHVHLGDHRPAQGRGAHPPQPAHARVQPDHHPRLGPRRPGQRPRRAAVPHRRPGRGHAAAADGRRPRDPAVGLLRPGRDPRPDGAGAGLEHLPGPGHVGGRPRRPRHRRPRPLAPAPGLLGRRAGLHHPAARADRRLPPGAR